MSDNREIFDSLVKLTVYSVLFTPKVSEVNNCDHLPVPKAIEENCGEIQPGTILCLLTSDEAKQAEDPAGDKNDNNAAELNRSTWIKDCPNWSIQRLREEKAILKRHLQKPRIEKTSLTSVERFRIHEAYALLKLYLIERDSNYRQQLQQSNSFLTNLHVLLTLYKTHFERAYGKQISTAADIKPVETLYNFFLTHSDSTD